MVAATGDPGVSAGARGVVAEEMREGTGARGVEAAEVQEGSTYREVICTREGGSADSRGVSVGSKVSIDREAAVAKEASTGREASVARTEVSGGRDSERGGKGRGKSGRVGIGASENFGLSKGGEGSRS